uniref:Siphovirus Gp157 family protein n=1 Tax=Magnetococcus massalia (strain MO-1) TaxID=451514 RepID=A0A1S7LGS8_MAGMO|nr:conserved protein of unknown function [include Siphovirus Gp157 protein domain] [Candidatus Magnetococcus massalia]
MGHLYEMSGDYRRLFEAYERAAESGDETAAEELAASLDGISDELGLKVINMMGYVKELELLASGRREAARVITDGARALENKAAHLKKLVLSAMALTGATRFSSDAMVVTRVNKPAAVVIEDEGLIPAAYWEVKQVERLDKRGMLADMKQGKPVEGAKLVRGETLRTS